MKEHYAFINPDNGTVTEATQEQIKEYPDQILVIHGIQALASPPIWIGEYNGELLFYPWKLTNLNGEEALSIKVNNVVIKRINNYEHDKHKITYILNERTEEKTSFGPFSIALRELAGL